MSRITPDRDPKVECQIAAESGQIYITARAGGVVLKQEPRVELGLPLLPTSLIHLTLDEARELAQDLADAIEVIESAS
jgi:hypothetical protein